MHRDPIVYPKPESFDPYRWQEPSNEMWNSLLAFGGGSHGVCIPLHHTYSTFDQLVVCIGSHFAQLELRHALANFCRIVGPVKPAQIDGFGEKDMVQVSFFLSPPKGKKCFLQRRKPSL